MKHLSKFLSAAALAMMASTATAATVVYDNGGPNTMNGYSINGSNVTTDDFTLSQAATITSVTFYFQNYNGITDWNLDIDYTFSSDVNASSVLASGEGQNLTAVDSGQPWCCGGGNAYQVDFELETAFVAQAGTTYWLGLSGASGAPSAWWVTTDFVNGNSNRSGQDFAFSLSADDDLAPIPVPASLPLIASGLFGLAAIGRRRKSA